MKITLVGTQIPQWLPGLAADLFFACKLPCQLCIHEANEAMGQLAQDYLAALIRHAGVEGQARFTPDLKEALTGAEGVIYADACQNASSFLNDREALKGSDENDPGLTNQARPQGGLEGLMMTLRVGGRALDLCEAMAEYCPRAIVINLSQPLNQITALFQQQGFAAYGLEGGPLRGSDGMEGLCHVLKRKRLTFQSAGLNGFAFLTLLKDGEANMLPKAHTRVKHGDWGVLKKRWLDWYGMIPLGSEHGQYLPAQPDYEPDAEPRLSEPVEKRKERILHMHTVAEKGADSREGAMAQVTLLSQVSPARPGLLLAALTGKTSATLPAVIMRNDGRMPQLPARAVIEAPLALPGDNPPIRFTQEAAAILEEIAQVHQLSAQAAAGDRQALRDVIETDPALAGLDRLYCLDVAEALIRLNEALLTRF